MRSPTNAATILRFVGPQLLVWDMVHLLGALERKKKQPCGGLSDRNWAFASSPGIHHTAVFFHT